MIQQQILAGHHSKHYKSEFIYKLVDMMKNFSSLVRWSQNGTSVQFFKVSEIEKRVLPLYFRHSNFDSFLRQLHLYNFKQNKQSKDRLLFDHGIFKKGNEKEFIHIQRIKNKKEKESLLKQLQNSDILNMISQNACLDKSSKDILNIMFSYKLIVLQKQKSLRQKLNHLQQIVKSNRNPKVKQTMTILEDEIKVQLDSNKKFSKSIDIFLTQTLKEKSKQLQQKQQQFQNIKEKQNFNFQKQHNLTNHNEKRKTKQNSQLEPQGKLAKAIKIDSGVFQQKQHENKVVKKQTSNELINLSEYFSNFKSVNSYELDFNHKNIISQFIPNRNDFLHSKQVKLSQELNPFISPSMILFNLKEDDGMYMPLHFYNRSVGSELFERYNATEHVSMEIEKKQNLQGFKSKSQQFQTSEKPIQTDNNPNISKQMHDNDDSQISFMNDK